MRSEYLIINGYKLPWGHLKGYYHTGLFRALMLHAETRDITSWVEIALRKIVKDQKFWSELELRRHFWDLYFLTSKFSVDFDPDFIIHVRSMLDKIYDHVWDMPTSFQRVFALDPFAEEHEGLLKELVAFEQGQRDKGDTETADLIKDILLDIESFYSLG